MKELVGGANKGKNLLSESKRKQILSFKNRPYWRGVSERKSLGEGFLA